MTVGTYNVGILTGKSMELGRSFEVKTFKMRVNSILSTIKKTIG